MSDSSKPAGRGPSVAGLSLERLQEVLGRLASGFYDRPEVRSLVAERLCADWNRGSA